MVSGILRSRIVPRSLSYQLWRATCKAYSREKFFFPTTVFGKRIVYGGVCGFSNDALFADLQAYEENTVKVLSSILSREPNPVAFDVGANNGQFLVLAKALRADAAVHCFEPFPELTSFLEELVHRNSFEAVYVNNLLVGDCDGMGELHYAEGATDTASSVQDFQPSFNRGLRVQQSSLDSYVAEKAIRHLSLIKIDVEGGELEVLTGARSVLERLQPDIILELLYSKNPAHLARQQAAINLLNDLDYGFYLIRADGNLERQYCVEPDPTYRFVNYFVTVSNPSGLCN